MSKGRWKEYKGEGVERGEMLSSEHDLNVCTFTAIVAMIIYTKPVQDWACQYLVMSSKEQSL